MAKAFRNISSDSQPVGEIASEINTNPAAGKKERRKEGKKERKKERSPSDKFENRLDV